MNGLLVSGGEGQGAGPDSLPDERAHGRDASFLHIGCDLAKGLAAALCLASEQQRHVTCIGEMNIGRGSYKLPMSPAASTLLYERFGSR